MISNHESLPKIYQPTPISNNQHRPATININQQQSTTDLNQDLSLLTRNNHTNQNSFITIRSLLSSQHRTASTKQSPSNQQPASTSIGQHQPAPTIIKQLNKNQNQPKTIIANENINYFELATPKYN